MSSANLGQLLLQAFRWVDDSLRATLEARGWPPITQAQSLLFANLEPQGARTAELARRLGVSRQAVHRTVRELAELGYVEQVRDPANASAKLVRLTDAGTANVRAALAAFRDIEDELAGRIGPDKLAALRSALGPQWGPPCRLPEPASPARRKGRQPYRNRELGNRDDVEGDSRRAPW